MEAVRRAIEVFNRDGSEAAAAFLDPEIEWHDLPEQPDAGVHHGRNGFLAATEQFTGGFEYLRVLIDEIFDHGDQVITHVRFVGRGRGTAARPSSSDWQASGPCEMDPSFAWNFSERRVRPSKPSAWRSKRGRGEFR